MPSISVMPQGPETLAVVVMYNSHEEVARCVETLLAQTAPGLEILVVDNGSADDSGARTRARFAGDARVSVLEMRPNRGFSGGANFGFKAALARNPRFVWLLTDDLELAPEALGHLREALEADPRIGLAGQYILDRAHPEILYYGGGRFAPEGALHEHKGERLEPGGDPGPARDTDYATGASMFWRAEALAAVGGMDEAFWLYWEDADLSHRCRLAGWRVVVVPRACSWHDVTPEDDPSMPLRTRYSTRNELRFCRKHGLGPTRKRAWKTFKWGLKRWLRNRDEKAWAAGRGALDHLLGRTGPIRGRW